MASWRKPGGGLHCNFTTELGGPHRGEVLAGTRVSVCAPTQNGSGPYELINPEATCSFVEVADLASIGIFPEVRDPQNASAASPPAMPLSPGAAPPPVQPPSLPPLLLDLLGGITITILVAPLLLAAVGFVGWQILQRRIRQCPACGFSGVGGTVCPACGTLYQQGSNGSAGEHQGAPGASAQVVDRLVDLDASQVTIDVSATDVED